MSTRRVTPKASTPLATNGGSRLEHVLSVGMSNLSINKPTVTPEKAAELSFANAHKAPIMSLSTVVLCKTRSVVPTANIGVKWETWPPGGEEEKVQKWLAKIEDALSILPNVGGNRNNIHSLVDSVKKMRDLGGVASPISANKFVLGYYVYLLQVVESALRSAQAQGSTDPSFERNWPGIVRAVDKKAAKLAKDALNDPDITDAVRHEIFAYFNYCNELIYNYFTEGNIMNNPELARNTSPELTQYLYERGTAEILRGMTQVEWQ